MKSLYLLLLICTTAFAETYFLSSEDKLSHALKRIDESDFGKNLLDTIALQLNSNTPMGDIATLI